MLGPRSGGQKLLMANTKLEKPDKLGDIKGVCHLWVYDRIQGWDQAKEWINIFAFYRSLCLGQSVQIEDSFGLW